MKLINSIYREDSVKIIETLYIHYHDLDTDNSFISYIQVIFILLVLISEAQFPFLTS